MESVMAAGDTRWALGYLRGQMKGYKRGSVHLRQLAAAVRVSLERNVSLDDIRVVLAIVGLQWDPTGKMLTNILQ
jgi:hypothetical protein